MMLRNTFAEIDLNAIKNNISIVRKTAAKSKILFAVKADGYGHGMVEVATFTEKNRMVDYFGVASIEEGVELRENGITLPILILGLTLPVEKNIDYILKYNLASSAADDAFIDLLNKTAFKNKKKCVIHIKTDTGMGRVGCTPDDALKIAEFASNCSNIELEGIFSHMPVSDDISNSFNDHQISVYKSMLRRLESKNINIPVKHLANSAAILNYPETHFDMVRPGIICYGYRPDYKSFNNTGIIPSMSLKSQIIFTKFVKKGTKLSYGLTYEVPDNSYISTIPIGYGDGYSRSFSNIGKVIIGDEIFPVVGRVCMDQLLINTGSKEFAPGTEITLFDKKHFTVDDAANAIQTISYEITCGISQRVPRLYLNA